MNADYEAQLFYGRPGPAAINHSLEFLVLFLEDMPLLTSKKYTKEYLEYVASVSGKNPQILSSGEAENWWGSLEDLETERRLNSKVTSTELNTAQGWCPDSHIVNSENDLKKISWSKKYLVKNPWGMSGQRFRVIEGSQEEQEWLKKSVQQGTLILEPYLNRQKDFSCFITPDGERFFYENVIDTWFQYKGSVFQTYPSAKLTDLSFYQDLPKAIWQKYNSALEVIIKEYHRPQQGFGFSIDSFTYEEGGEVKIKALSEVNHRRTMGRVTQLLARQFGQNKTWAMLVIGKSLQAAGGFRTMRKRLKNIECRSMTDEGVVILSPGDTRFELFFLTAKSKTRGLELLQELSQLLPESQLPIKI